MSSTGTASPLEEAGADTTSTSGSGMSRSDSRTQVGGQHLCSASSNRTQAQRHDDSHDDLLVADGRLTHATRPDLNAAGLWMTM